ncbi:putative membrane protein YedE/YeeE [Rhizobium sp. SG_E_25_P2]|uniref:YeeE/YedE family protein n=1 Tax=Rhizobium sp. SG_E_25_P2 TaxID=2879942 RepID=UPI00247426AF|nr:YeeE/YedE family protein [Rhizobium sp. SG_E_25_P2]MDH6264674.1 putative membrane protein YedE/YeeE [Rhizobium sp. SG_E_25_P2]
MTDFTPLQSLIGGGLIGLSAVLLMAFHGRIAGMTGLLAGVLPPLAADWPWRAAFLAGAALSPILWLASGREIAFSSPATPWALATGGFVVGLGVVLGGGCPSGHGVCGIARFSKRSIAATLTFMATAFVSVFVLRHLIGAA